VQPEPARREGERDHTAQAVPEHHQRLVGVDGGRTAAARAPDEERGSGADAP
jgi:hypothetical protein